VRPSLSLAGAMVLSVVVDGAVKHMALDGNQLDTRSLEVCAKQRRSHTDKASHNLRCIRRTYHHSCGRREQHQD
jgi:hypothetical protein